MVSDSGGNVAFIILSGCPCGPWSRTISNDHYQRTQIYEEGGRHSSAMQPILCIILPIHISTIKLSNKITRKKTRDLHLTLMSLCVHVPCKLCLRHLRTLPFQHGHQFAKSFTTILYYCIVVNDYSYNNTYIII